MKNFLSSFFIKLKRNQFLFEELVKRDFKQKYKRTVLGMGWSVMAPLLNLLVLTMVFKNFFGRGMPHYTIYLFCGQLVFAYFRESTTGGMGALMANASIFSKVNVPKYMFLLSKNISALINFGLTLIIFFLFVIVDQVPIGMHFLTLIYPIFCLVIFNVGIGLILSAMFVFFRDTSYLYDVFITLLMYLSAIFYQVDTFAAPSLFLLNPVYCYIFYFRTVVLQGTIPSLGVHVLCMVYALIAIAVGGWIYKKNNHLFLYYI